MTSDNLLIANKKTEKNNSGESAGEILRVVLKKHNVGVRQLARAIGINPHYLYRCVSDNPKLRVDMSTEKLKKILRALPEEAKIEFFENFAYEKTD